MSLSTLWLLTVIILVFIFEVAARIFKTKLHYLTVFAVFLVMLFMVPLLRDISWIDYYTRSDTLAIMVGVICVIAAKSFEKRRKPERKDYIINITLSFAVIMAAIMFYMNVDVL